MKMSRKEILARLDERKRVWKHKQEFHNNQLFLILLNVPEHTERVLFLQKLLRGSSRKEKSK